MMEQVSSPSNISAQLVEIVFKYTLCALKQTFPFETRTFGGNPNANYVGSRR